ncbi:MAG: hypothetical protein RL701_3842 [Pseudomonadota bacterium]
MKRTFTLRDGWCKLAAVSGGLILAVTAALGCEDDLPKASQITHMRVLGAATEVVGDPARTTPKPGETAQLTWSMVYPDTQTDDSRLSSLFLVCTTPQQFAGIPVCQEILERASAGTSLVDLVKVDGKPQKLPDCKAEPNQVYKYDLMTAVCVANTPKLEIAVPKGVKASRLVLGTICRNGTPSLDLTSPTLMSCKAAANVVASEIESIAVYGTIPIQFDDTDRNENPNVEGLSLTFHNPPIPWLETDADAAATVSDETCLDLSKTKRVMHSEGHEEEITLRYDASLRELLDGEPEPLEFSGYTTFGELSRRFTVFRSDAVEPLESTFTWEISEQQRAELNEKSKRVRFFFTISDHRGGFSIVKRDLCINRQ